jgi:hypothetical protein
MNDDILLDCLETANKINSALLCELRTAKKEIENLKNEIKALKTLNAKLEIRE